MANKITIKKSSVPAKVPLPADLDFGELGINYADGKLYYKNSSLTIKYFTSADEVLSKFGAKDTGGVLDWNDATNTKPGAGYTLLMGNATNGPGAAAYYHPFNLEYNTKDGTGNVTQMAISYANANGELFMRGRYASSWQSWVRFLNSGNFSSYVPQLTGAGASGSWGISVTGNAATATTLQTSRTINGVAFNGASDIAVPSLYDTNYRRITNPGGGEQVTASPSRTGAITITLPVAMIGQMVRMTIKVYEYITNRQFEVHCGGYMYESGGTKTWANNPFAYIVGNPLFDRRFTVRFGHNSVSNKGVIYIGELDSTWQYPQIFVTDVQVGYSYQVNWTTGWQVGFETTAFQDVSATIQNCQVGYTTSTNIANATVLRDASGNFAANAITLSSIQSTSVINVLNASAAQGMKLGSLVVSGQYANNAPTNGIYSAGQIQSAVATGTAPLIVASTTAVTNLNADLLDGNHASAFLTAANPNYTGTLTGSTGIINIGAGQFYKSATGDVGIGTVSPAYTLEVNGSFAATTKSFVIDHPTKEGKKLRYGSLEGPENGVYVRGKQTDRSIELPEYWTKLVDPDSITVQLTAVGKPHQLWVVDIKDNTVYIDSDSEDINCFYYILAERVDVDKLQVEID